MCTEQSSGDDPRKHYNREEGEGGEDVVKRGVQVRFLEGLVVEDSRRSSERKLFCSISLVTHIYPEEGTVIAHPL